MFDLVFDFLARLDSIFWSYFAFVLIMLLGSTLTFASRFFQIRAFPSILKTFYSFLVRPTAHERGVHPLRAFFASVGGMIGIGNVVGIATAVQLGGPGALFWVWIAALIGGIIKYSEIYLGLKYRVPNERGGYDGGPMYFLQQAFKNRLIPSAVSLLLCLYGVEIYQFAVVTQSISINWDINRYIVMAVLLAAILYASLGGVSRIGKICSAIMPLFVLGYITMGLWIIFHNLSILPDVLATVFYSAFNGHAAVGGFAGSTIFLAIQHGIARAAYSADIGIGYDSIIQSESNVRYPQQQARLAILGVCLDNVVCTMSIVLLLLSGVWAASPPVEASQMVQTVLSNYFPYMHLFMPLFLMLVGYMTMIAYFCVGIKCARFLNPGVGSRLYVVYGVCALIFFSFFDPSRALIVMSVVQALLLITNLLGIFRLRHDVCYIVSEGEDLSEQRDLISDQRI